MWRDRCTHRANARRKTRNKEREQDWNSDCHPAHFLSASLFTKSSPKLLFAHPCLKPGWGASQYLVLFIPPSTLVQAHHFKGRKPWESSQIHPWPLGKNSFLEPELCCPLGTLVQCLGMAWQQCGLQVLLVVPSDPHQSLCNSRHPREPLSCSENLQLRKLSRP